MLSSHRAASLAITAAVAALVSGCLLDSSAFEAAGAGAASGTTTGSGGGATTSTTTVPSSGGSGVGAGGAAAGGGGAGGAGGAAAGGAGGGTTTTSPPCTVDGDCPDDPSSCLGPRCDKGTCTTKNTNEGGVCGEAMSVCHDVARCKAGACESKPLPNDHPVEDMDPGNCQKNVCDGQGAVKSKNDDSDVPDSSYCALRTCMGGAVKEVVQNEGKTCFLGSECCSNARCCGFGCTVCFP